MIDDGEPAPVVPGDAVWIPKGVWHSTLNTSYELMVILTVYAPAGPRTCSRTCPSFTAVPAGLRSKCGQESDRRSDRCPVEHFGHPAARAAGDEQGDP